MEEALIKKTPPYSARAEQSVIGSMLMDKDAILIATEILTGEDFYQRQYQILFNAMAELNSAGKPVDLVTLQEKLREMEVPPELNSIEFISGLVNSVPISVNVRDHAQIVKDKAVMRRLIRITEEIQGACYLNREPLEDILETTEKQIFDVVQNRNTSDFVPVQEVVISAVESIERAAKSNGSITGIATGFYDLDYKMAGLQPSNLILVAARPSMGKTAFVLNIAEYVAVKSDISTAIFSLEMSAEDLIKRILAMNSKVDAQVLRNGNLKDDDWSRLFESVDAVGNSKLIIDDTPGISVTELRSKCRKYKMEHDLGLVIIDYLQLMSGSKRSESRQQEISDISRSLKALARELDVPVIALSQLSRAVEQRPDKRPMLSDLRESGAIEQDADVVMFIYRDDYYNHESEHAGEAEIIIGKQRNGPTGTVRLKWLPEFTKFGNLERH
ncbi:MAG: replicative DNA helicase [Clostridiales bacterium]|nr:replicative DNA helicase [Clostridiales bacterium]